MASVDEANIASAIEVVANGGTQRAAAALYQVHPSTLSRRLRGTTSARASKVDCMRLSPVQERFLVDWSLQEEAAKRAPSKAQLSRMASLVLAEGDDQKPVGYR